jgi:hypothetical protein
MNIIAAGISVLFGTAFLAVEIVIPYYPSIFGSEPSKAHAAVARLLLNPDSATFSDERDIQLPRARYVCGKVDGKDRSGSYAGQRAFVYDVISDYAVIDDDGRITRTQSRFKPCPRPQEDTGPLMVDLGQANRIVAALPKGTIQTLAALKSPSAANSGASLGQSLEQLVASPALASVAGPNGPSDAAATAHRSSALSPFPVAMLADEKEWRADQPPRQWPKFAAADALSKSGPKLSNREALELAAEIDGRWKRFESGKSTLHPSMGEIEEALRALLAIKEQSSEFPQAWASFVALRKIQRAASAMAER